MCCMSATASAQSFDLGAAMHKERTTTNSKRTRLNKALSPFYSGRLTTTTILKPELKADDDEVNVIYPVQLTINGAKYKAAIAPLTKIFDSIGKRASDPNCRRV